MCPTPPIVVRTLIDIWKTTDADSAVSARTGTLLCRWSPHPSLWRCSLLQPSTICQPELSHCARCRLSTYGCRAFDYAGPTVWNSLPDELRNSALCVRFLGHFTDHFDSLIWTAFLRIAMNVTWVLVIWCDNWTFRWNRRIWIWPSLACCKNRRQFSPVTVHSYKMRMWSAAYKSSFQIRYGMFLSRIGIIGCHLTVH